MKLAVFVLAVLLAGASSDEIDLTATSVNVAEPGTPVKIKILRWSTDDERAPLVRALSAPPPTPAAAAQPARGGAPAGRGRGRGRGAAAAPLSPIAAFTVALGRAQTIGYVWTNDITGYAIKYAWRTALPDGTERVVLASDRRLGAYSGQWKSPTGAPETDYAFTIIELHVGPNGSLEGKSSLTSKIAVDGDTKTVALENYTTATTILTSKPTVGAARPTVHP